MRLLVFIVCLLPLSALAGDDLVQAEKYFKRLEYRQAIKSAEKALNQRNADHKSLVAAYRMRGLCFAAIGKTKKAVAAFSRLLAIEPSFRLSKMVSPKLTPAFYQALGLASDRKPIRLFHDPPHEPQSIAGLHLSVLLESNPFQMVSAVRLRYRVADAPEQRISKNIKGTGQVLFSLPKELSGRRLSYFFEALNTRGGVLLVDDAGGQAFAINLKPKPQLQKQPVAALSAPAVEPPPLQPSDTHSTTVVMPAGTPWYKSWWFWTAVGVVAAGAATGTALALTAGGSSSGTYHYGVEVR